MLIFTPRKHSTNDENTISVKRVRLIIDREILKGSYRVAWLSEILQRQGSKDKNSIYNTNK